MASHQSRRSSSLNSLFPPYNDRQPSVATGKKMKSASDEYVKRYVDMQFRKLESKARAPPPPMYRPSRSVSQASEAHIHRIRNATSKLDFKENHLKIMPVAMPLTAYNTERNWSEAVRSRSFPLPAIAEEDEDGEDTESVDWMAPLDITSYFYKSEYIIHPKSARKFDEKSGKADKIGSKSAGDGNNGPLVDSQLVESVTDDAKSRSTRSRSGSKTSLYGKDIPDYGGFIKELNNEIRDLTLETKRMEQYSPRSSKQEESREETIARGYVTLKRIYELNPELTESAARKHICGSAGNPWMGLTRVEVMQIMKRIRREFKAPPIIYTLFHGRYSSKKFNTPKKKSNSNSRQSQASKEGIQGRPKPGNGPKFRPSQIQMEHVPGPKHLKTNICIRPWEPTLDGWSVDDDEREDSELYGYDNDFATYAAPYSQSISTQVGAEESDDCQPDWFDPSPREAPKKPPNTAEPEENDGASQDDDEELTMEICNPTYRLNC